MKVKTMRRIFKKSNYFQKHGENNQKKCIYSCTKISFLICKRCNSSGYIPFLQVIIDIKVTPFNYCFCIVSADKTDMRRPR